MARPLARALIDPVVVHQERVKGRKGPVSFYRPQGNLGDRHASHMCQELALVRQNFATLK